MTGFPDLELRDVLTAPDTRQGAPKAIIAQVYSDGTVDLDTANGPAAGALVLASYTPRIGDVVRYLRADAATLLVLGTVRSGVGTTVDVDSPLTLAYNVEPATVTPANPLVVTAIDAGSYRNGWEASDVRQGAASTRGGWWYGAYFYGTGAFDALRGRYITSATIRIARAADGRGTQPVILAPHIHPTRPSSTPYFTTAGRDAGDVAEGGTVEVSLPLDFAQALADGKAAGIGHNYSGTSDYAICDSLAADPLSGRLTLGWA